MSFNTEIGRPIAHSGAKGGVAMRKWGTVLAMVLLLLPVQQALCGEFGSVVTSTMFLKVADRPATVPDRGLVLALGQGPRCNPAVATAPQDSIVRTSFIAGASDKVASASAHATSAQSQNLHRSHIGNAGRALLGMIVLALSKTHHH
jgi:hypothetical protein